MTHLAKTIKGNNILTFCGKYIDRQTLGRRTRGRPPAVLYKKGQIPKNPHEKSNAESEWVLSLCKVCLDNPESVSVLNEVTNDVLRTRNTIHISKGSKSSYIPSLCGLKKTTTEYLKSDEGFIILPDYEEFTRGFHNKYRLCNECRNHPAVQLKDLANVEL